MRSTIKLGAGRAIVVQPQGEGVRFDLTFAGVVVGGDVLTPDQCGALVFSIEQAAEAAGIAQDRMRASEGTASAQRINRTAPTCPAGDVALCQGGSACRGVCLGQS
ncbi:hypothetical protein [uncultured Hydrogenophaga sp.]|uniref:hypothetical protein n=1 Tax=uncultured Hydrogenophaga sp. TaxID=199683 RepID=UPI00265D7879|nr:hypothetical protein [uncultured Hydrogenophaga sp.]